MKRGEGIVGDLRLAPRRPRRGRSTCRHWAARPGRHRRSASGGARASAPRPRRPGLARRGARLVDDLKWALPKPPLPPSASSTRWPSRSRSATSVSLSSSKICVPTGTFSIDVVAAGAGAVAAHAVAAVLRLEMLLVAVVDERVEAVDAFGPDVAAAAAVAAVGSAELDELLAAEGDRAVPAVAGADIDLGLIEKFHASAVRVLTARLLVGMAATSQSYSGRACTLGYAGRDVPRAGANRPNNFSRGALGGNHRLRQGVCGWGAL